MLVKNFYIACNDTGAFLFNRSCYNDARQLFQIAMTIMKLIEQGIIFQKTSVESILSTPCSTTAIDEEQHNKFEWALQRILLKTKGDVALLNACSSTNQQDTNQKHPVDTCKRNDSSCLETACAVYCEPIELMDIMVLEDCELDSSCEKENQSVWLEFCASAMMFNMGLSYHIMRDDLASSSASAAASTTSDALQIASIFYGLVYSTLVEHKNTIMMTSNSHLYYPYHRLMIVVLNNTAQISEELGNFNSMQQYLGMLISFHEELSLSQPSLSSINSSGHEDFLQDVGGFLWFARSFKGLAAWAA